MTYITIHVPDVKKAKLLYELLRSMDFIESIDTDNSAEKKDTISPDAADDFFALAGMWADRDIDLTWIRQKAWPRQQPVRS